MRFQIFSSAGRQLELFVPAGHHQRGRCHARTMLPLLRAKGGEVK